MRTRSSAASLLAAMAMISGQTPPIEIKPIKIKQGPANARKKRLRKLQRLARRRNRL